MIFIKDKKDCVGCFACGDVCAKNAISFKTDIEGFGYPDVDQEACVACGLCEKVCPVLNADESKKGASARPIVYAAQHRSNQVRVQSTSGGLFSAFAEQKYDSGGAVGGVVFTADFHAEHFISADPKDLIKLCGSKYFQSDMRGFYHKVKAFLDDNRKVMICGTPCQTAALKLFFKQELDNLTLVEVICLGINSPKVFQCHLQTLERKFGGKAVKVRAKNKDKGWRSLACKMEFDNGKTYYRQGIDDDFTRGFISVNLFLRPSCFHCKFRGFPRCADLTIGDFWGIEKTRNTLDDDMGTSVVFINTEKGNTFFEATKERLNWEEHFLYEAVVANRALISDAGMPKIDRNHFFTALDEMSFDKVAQKFFPKKRSVFMKMKNLARKLSNYLNRNTLSPVSLWQTLQISFFRPNTNASLFKKRLFLSDIKNALDIHSTAKINLNGICKFGFKRNAKSKIESGLLLEENSLFEVGTVQVYYGADFQVFKNAKLRIGKAVINKNVQIICMESITIGHGCLISRDVVIRDNDGGHHVLAPEYRTTAPVVIGDHVWIGHGAMIMKGVTIGDGAIIGAGAWVATNVKPRCVVMGDPSRTVQKNVEWVN